MEEQLELEQEKNAALAAALEEAQATIAGLETKLAEAKKGNAPSVANSLPTFKLDKAEYQFTVGSFNHEGTDYTAAEAAKDKILQKELVEGGYGVIVKL